MALFVVTLGVGMAIKTQQPLVVIASIAIGSLIGELMDLEGALEAASMKLENRIGDSAVSYTHLNTYSAYSQNLNMIRERSVRRKKALLYLT